MKNFLPRWMIRILPVGLFLAGVSAQAQDTIPTLDVQALINAAVSRPDSVLKLPEGTYRVPPHCLSVRGAKNLTIDGSETTLLLTQFDNDGIRFDECSGLTLKGLTLDYDPLPFTQGTIVAKSADHSTIDVEIQNGYPNLDKNYNSSRIHIFNGKKLEWKRGCPEGFYRDIEYLSPRKARLSLDSSMQKKGQSALLQPGDMIVFSMRRASAVQFFRSRDITMENVTILSSPAVAVTARNCDGNNRFLRLRVERGPRPSNAQTGRLLSTNADALNYGYSRKGPLIEGCEFSFMGDDGINLHGPTFFIVRTEEPNVIWCLRRTSANNIRRFYDNIILPGDPVRILDANNFAIKKQINVTRLETDLTPPFVLTRQEILAANSFANYPREGYLRITLSDASGVKTGDMIDFPAANASGFTIRNNKIHDVRPRGMRIMASNGVIENNSIARTTQPGIALGGHYAFYREAGWVSNVIVRRNTLEDIGIGAEITPDRSPCPAAICIWSETAVNAPAGTASASNHHDIQIVGNKITGCTVEGIAVSGLVNATLSGNILSDCNTSSPQTPLDNGKVPRGHAITVMNSSRITVDNNNILKPEDYPSGTIWIQPGNASPNAK
jgi:hypothetical protein